MRDQIEFSFNNNQSEGLYDPPQNWDESDINILITQEPSGSKRELEQLFLEAQEYNFLMSHTPQVMPDNWVEEEE